MSRGHAIKLAVVLTVVISLAIAGAALAKGSGGKPTVEYTNNLSFPVIAADGKTVAEVDEVFTVPYLVDGTAYTDPAYDPASPWYAQKVTGNTWNADFVNSLLGTDVVVHGVDWGDNISSVSPTIGRPYRLETGLYADVSAAPMTGYVMKVLANASSPDEVQGTNTATYESGLASITSEKPRLRIQRIEGYDSATLVWDSTQDYWVTALGAAPITPTTISFAPELNVAGKYIFGASTGGWKPTALGTYRITFFMPSDSDVVIGSGATLGNLSEVPAPGTSGPTWVEQTTAENGALPVVRADLNLSYVDVVVIAKGGK